MTSAAHSAIVRVMKHARGWAAALVASLGFNVYLLATRGSEPEAAATAADVKARAAAAERAEIPTATPRQGAVSAEVAAEHRVASEEAERAADLAAELAKAQAELARSRPLNQRYEDADRTPAVESSTVAMLDKVFQVAPGAKRPYTLECHGQICKLVVDDNLNPDVWMEALQGGDNRFSYRSAAFTPTGEYLEMNTSEEEAASRYTASVLELLGRAPGLEDCKRRSPTSGHVAVHAELDASRRVQLIQDGPLADQAFGVCLAPVLAQVAAQAPAVPANVRTLPVRNLMINVRGSAPAAPPVERRGEPARLARSLAPRTR